MPLISVPVESRIWWNESDTCLPPGWTVDADSGDLLARGYDDDALEDDNGEQECH